MYAFFYLVISAAIFVLLVQINVFLGILFLILAIVALPASIIHRREVRYAPEIGQDAESHSQGVKRLVSVVGLDTTGIALGTLLLIFLLLVARNMAYH